MKAKPDDFSDYRDHAPLRRPYLDFFNINNSSPRTEFVPPWRYLVPPLAKKLKYTALILRIQERYRLDIKLVVRIPAEE